MAVHYIYKKTTGRTMLVLTGGETISFYKLIDLLLDKVRLASGSYALILQPPTLSGNITFTLPNADGAAGQVIQTNGAGVLSFTDKGGGAGYVTEAFKTIAVPAGGNPVADGPTDTLTLAAGSAKVTITGDAETDTVTFDIVNAQIDHDALLNFVANKHINWTNASVNLVTSGNVQGAQLISSVADGTAPVSVTSSTVCPNLNADTVDARHASYFAVSTHGHPDLVSGNAPVGSVLAWIGGYFTDGANGGYTRTLGDANTVAGANVYLNSTGWWVCDGSAVNEPTSPIFNGAGRYLPNITDSRFLQGYTELGATGGANTMAHTHGAGTYASANESSHTHGVGTIAAGSHTHAVGTLAAANESAHTHGVGTYAVGSHAHGTGTYAAANESTHTHGVGTYAAADESTHTHGAGTFSAASHAHGAGTYAVAAEAAHTHAVGTLAAAAEAVHTHAVGTLAVASHAHGTGTYAAANESTHMHAVSTISGAGGAHSHGVGTLAAANESTHTHSVSATSGAGGAHSHGAGTLAVGNESAHTHGVGTLDAAAEATHTHAAGAISVGNESSHTHGTGTLDAAAEATHTHAAGAISVGNESSHTHGTGTLDAAAEAAHTHSAGAITVNAEASHTHGAWTLANAA